MSKESSQLHMKARGKVAVKPQGVCRSASSSPGQVENSSRADQTDLLERTLERDNLLLALKRIKQNKGAAGIDGMEVAKLPEYAKENWLLIKVQLLTGTYKAKPVKWVEIPKPGGGVRLLGIPTVTDRFLQQALLQDLTPIINPLLPNSMASDRAWAARMIAYAESAPWAMARNTNNALDTSYWKDRGLKSLLERYVKLR